MDFYLFNFILQLTNFIHTGINYKKIISAVSLRAVVTAIDDKIVPTEFSKELADNLEAKFFQLSTGGHLLDSDGFSKFPKIHEIITNMIADKQGYIGNEND